MDEIFAKIDQALKELDSEIPEKRRSAVIKLRDYSHENISPVSHRLIKTIHEDSDQIVRISAIQALIMIGDNSKLQVLLKIALDDFDNKVRIAAIRGLALLKDSIAINSLTKIVNRSDNEAIITAASLAIQIIQGHAPEWSLDDMQ